MGKFIDTLMSRPLMVTSLKVSLVVGTVLNAINQGGVIFEEGDISWGLFAMNYIVPYCVAIYSAAQNEMRRTNKKENINDDK